MAQFPLPGSATAPHRSLSSAFDMVSQYLSTLDQQQTPLALANWTQVTGRIDAKARGLSPSASHADNQALLNDLLAEAATLGQEVWIGDGDFPCHVLTLYPHQRIDGSGTLVQDRHQHMFDGLAIDDVLIKGIGIMGTYATGRQIGGSAIELRNATNIALNRVKVENWGTVCVSFENIRDFIAVECEFNSIAGSAFRLQETLGRNRQNDRVWFHRNRITRASISEEIGNAAIQAHGGGNHHHAIWITENVVDGAKVALGLDILANSFIAGNELYRSSGESIAITGLNNMVVGNFARTAAAAGLLFWGEENRSRGLHAMYNDFAGCEQGVALAFGQDNVVFDDVLMVFNRLNNNRVFGAQSYLDGGSEGLGYGDVLFAWNEMIGNQNGASNFIPGHTGFVREIGTLSGNGTNSSDVGENVLWKHLRTIATELTTPQSMG